MNEFFSPPGIPLLGHRGCRGQLTENTLGAFRAALDGGADGVEFDVRFTRDECPVVVHDPDLERVTKGRVHAVIAEVSVHELADVSLPCGQNVPSLQDTLDWARKNDALLNLEVKGEVANTGLSRRLQLELERAAVPASTLVLSCFDYELACELQDNLAPYSVAFLCEGASDEAESWVARQRSGERPWLIHPQVATVDPAVLNRWARAGAHLGFWTVNTPREMTEVGAFAPALVISDVPSLLAPQLRRPS